jgi:hypothetical protein
MITHKLKFLSKRSYNTDKSVYPSINNIRIPLYRSIPLKSITCISQYILRPLKRNCFHLKKFNLL